MLCLFYEHGLYAITRRLTVCSTKATQQRALGHTTPTRHFLCGVGVLVVDCDPALQVINHGVGMLSTGGQECKTHFPPGMQFDETELCNATGFLASNKMHLQSTLTSQIRLLRIENALMDPLTIVFRLLIIQPLLNCYCRTASIGKHRRTVPDTNVPMVPRPVAYRRSNRTN